MVVSKSRITVSQSSYRRTLLEEPASYVGRTYPSLMCIECLRVRLINKRLALRPGLTLVFDFDRTVERDCLVTIVPNLVLLLLALWFVIILCGISFCFWKTPAYWRKQGPWTDLKTLIIWQKITAFFNRFFCRSTIPRLNCHSNIYMCTY